MDSRLSRVGLPCHKTSHWARTQSSRPPQQRQHGDLNPQDALDRRHRARQHSSQRPFTRTAVFWASLARPFVASSQAATTRAVTREGRHHHTVGARLHLAAGLSPQPSPAASTATGIVATAYEPANIRTPSHPASSTSTDMSFSGHPLSSATRCTSRTSQQRPCPPSRRQAADPFFPSPTTTRATPLPPQRHLFSRVSLRPFIG
jgi:hypothetical protein